MNQSLLILALAFIICLICAAGCTAPSGTVPSTAATAWPIHAVSFNATPVQYAQVNGVTLGYREFGAGEPVLMVQGFGATMDQWNETFIGILASKYHVYTYDHRGMGYSSTNNATPKISLYTDDAALLVPALGYDSMHVYGVSMGSSISQQLAIITRSAYRNWCWIPMPTVSGSPRRQNCSRRSNPSPPVL